MSETTSPPVADNPATDPLSAVADAMQAAAETVSDRATAACEAAGATLPTVGLFASRLLYTTCYAVSYGAVFPVVRSPCRYRRTIRSSTVSSTAHGPLGTRSMRFLVDSRPANLPLPDAGGISGMRLMPTMVVVTTSVTTTITTGPT